MPAWRQYQEEVAAFFRGLGLQADTDSPADGVRTGHDIDVIVTGQFAGFTIRWLVECKRWRYRVTKEKVLVLRSIVADTGADRGFIMAEAGYQRGALEAARLANVELTSLADLREVCAHELALERLRHQVRRVDELKGRYWTLPKSFRIETGLRGDWDPRAYSGDRVTRAVEACLIAALFYGFPAVYDEVYGALSHYSGSRQIAPGETSFVAHTATELADFIDVVLEELDGRLTAAEATYNQN